MRGHAQGARTATRRGWAVWRSAPGGWWRPGRRWAHVIGFGRVLNAWSCAGRQDCYAAWLGEVAERTGRLVAAWQAVGFCHGVLNTDNMSILGDTIDYGCALHPCCQGSVG